MKCSHSSRSKSAPKARPKKVNTLLKQALKRPGVKDVMRVYGTWNELQQASAQYQVFTSLPIESLLVSSSV